MAYSISEVEELTGVKQHVLRYWENIIPASAPKKDRRGYRVYTQREVDLFLRLKHLIEEKKYTIAGARRRLLEEMDVVSDKAELLQAVHELRTDLTDIYLSVRKYRPDGPT